jgi:hypothetical protein
MANIGWTDAQLEWLKDSGFSAAPSAILGRVVQFFSTEGGNVSLVATVTGLVVTDLHGVQLSISVPELLGQTITSVSFVKGTWRLDLVADGISFDRSILPGTLIIW